MQYAHPQRKRGSTVFALGTAVAMALQGIGATPALADTGVPTATPIKHLVVIFQENVSFDHYFGTYGNWDS